MLSHGQTVKYRISRCVHHVPSLGDHCEAIIESYDDRMLFLAELNEVVEGFNWLCHAYCLMSNHYHLMGGDAGR